MPYIIEWEGAFLSPGNGEERTFQREKAAVFKTRADAEKRLSKLERIRPCGAARIMRAGLILPILPGEDGGAKEETCNTRKTRMINIQIAPDGRVETGPIQFNNDWPGLFIRGDDCANFLLNLGAVLDGVDCPMCKFVTKGLQRLLSSPLGNFPENNNDDTDNNPPI